MVLLKNDGLLPLNPNVTSVALIGASWFAGQATMPPRSGNRNELVNVIAPYTVTPQQGLENTLRRLGSSARVTYNDGDVIADAVEVARSADVVLKTGSVLMPWVSEARALLEAWYPGRRMATWSRTSSSA